MSPGTTGSAGYILFLSYSNLILLTFFFLQYTQTECNLVGMVGAGVLSFKKGSHHTGQAGLNLSSVGITGIHNAVCIAFFPPHKKGTVIYTSVT